MLADLLKATQTAFHRKSCIKTQMVPGPDSWEDSDVQIRNTPVKKQFEIFSYLIRSLFPRSDKSLELLKDKSWLGCCVSKSAPEAAGAPVSFNHLRVFLSRDSSADELQVSQRNQGETARSGFKTCRGEDPSGLLIANVTCLAANRHFIRVFVAETAACC